MRKCKGRVEEYDRTQAERKALSKSDSNAFTSFDTVIESISIDAGPYCTPFRYSALREASVRQRRCRSVLCGVDTGIQYSSVCDQSNDCEGVEKKRGA